MDVDVVVAGAGPVGLMLAGELRLRGVSVLVVERLDEPSATVKAGSITVPTAEACDRRGLLESLAEVHAYVVQQMNGFAGQRPPAAAGPRRLAGHFGGLWGLDADRLDLTDPDLQAGPAAEVFMVPQQVMEQVLGSWATELGVEIRRGVELTGFVADESGVTVQLAPSGTVRAGWLVGCDGGRSTVRKLAGFDFPGTEPVITGHQAIVDLADAEKLPKGWNRTPVGMLVHGPVAGRILTVEFASPPADRDAPVTLAELQASLRHVSGTDVTITAVHSATRFTDNARQASTYRRGRVLLAGDAAHVHSPFGGQGLNLGIGDAVNLGWKLAGTIQGWAPGDLLDSYTTERHPVGAWVLEWTRAQVALMRPDAHTGALRDIVADLMATGDGNTYFVKKISGVDRHYDLGGGHPLVGRRTPDLELADGSRLADHCHDGRALLVDLAEDAELRALAAGWSDRVQLLTATAPGHPDLTGLLVRPDGHVAWAAGAADDRASLATALNRWFGAPAAVAVG
ncbi:MAG TPA: FAD-dependent monooxygenase [Pseudonocardiaceae bacterium]|nr:FAD-dependent monooxygenase [Pseudonocardiaceae bacterium]